MTDSLSRVAFVRGLALGGAALSLGANLQGCAKSDGPHAAAAENDFVPNVWVRIAPDDTYTFILAKSEMGQGIETGLTTVVAEELDVPFDRLEVEFALAKPQYVDTVFGDMTTGGSTSTADSWTPLRNAGASARAMLVLAAAKRWSVEPATCTTHRGTVVHAASKRSATYGALASEAATLPVPTAVPLKAPKNFTLIGNAKLKRNDIPGKVDGSTHYGIDTVVPGMVYASIERPPVFGGSVKSFDAAKAKAVAHVLDVVEVPSGIAVVATNTWAAFAGRKALAIVWNVGPNAKLDTKQLFAQAHAEIAHAKVAKRAGDVAGVRGGKVVEATYEFPFLAHAAMEPMNATADVRKDSCEVWAPTQVQTRALDIAAQITGLPASKCTIHTTYIGGAFGRRLDADYVADAVAVSKAIGKPAKVTWTREDDTKHDFYRPLSVNVLRGTLAENGTLVALSHAVSASSVMRRWAPPLFKGGIDMSALDGAQNQPYDVPNFEALYADPEHGIPVGFLRAPAANANTFAMETFVDELAHAAGKDPVAFRLAMLTKNPRAAGVLRAVTERAKARPIPSGAARGVALCYWGGSYGALVADVSLKDKNAFVHHVIMAVDPGVVINPDIVSAQVQGAVNYGLAMARAAKITIADGRVEQSNFYDFLVLRTEDAPNIDVVIVPSVEKPTGIGELGTPPIAPAVANAIFRLNGKRIRSLPFSDALA